MLNFLLLSSELIRVHPWQNGLRGATLPTFHDDLKFLNNHTEIHVLTDGRDRQVLVSPKLQGRVFTSTLGGPPGLSHGWINRELLESGEDKPHFNAYGGEDRYWMGPEAGQYALFFAPGKPFELEHSYVPHAFDKEPFDVAEKSAKAIRFRKKMKLPNYAGFTFQAELKRDIRLLDDGNIYGGLGIDADGLEAVGFESVNTVFNRGKEPWRKETGLVSIWILGMFQPSDKSTVVIPFLPGPERDLGPVVNDAYFGKVPQGRLKVGKDVLFFSGDGQCRSKIGVAPPRAKPVLGSWDAENKILTIVRYTLPEKPGTYVNSMWEIQEDPYAGDVVNSYNDGPPAPGKKPEGPFFELETSSPAAALKPGESLTHRHQTFHFAGDFRALDKAARKLLGASLSEIESALKPSKP